MKALLFNCTSVGRASDSVLDPNEIYLLVNWCPMICLWSGLPWLTRKLFLVLKSASITLAFLAISSFRHSHSIFDMSCLMTNPTKWLRPVKIQISQVIRQVWGPFFMRTAKTLIRLGGCTGWSESSLGAHSFCWFCHEAAHICLFCKSLCKLNNYAYLEKISIFRDEICSL